jgi:hypothetical protein
MRGYEPASPLITSNRLFEDRCTLLGDTAAAHGLTWRPPQITHGPPRRAGALWRVMPSMTRRALARNATISAGAATPVLREARPALSGLAALQNTRLGADAHGRFCPVHVWPVLRCPPNVGNSRRMSASAAEGHRIRERHRSIAIPTAAAGFETLCAASRAIGKRHSTERRHRAERRLR